MLEIIIEENCVVPPREELQNILRVVQEYLKTVVEKFSLTSLRYIVFTDSEQANFSNSVAKYATLIGTKQISLIMKGIRQLQNLLME